MIPSKTQALLSVWKNKPFAQLTILDVMHLSRKSSKPWVFNALKALEKRGLLVMARKGNLNLYSLNLENPVVPSLLHFLEWDEGFPLKHNEVIKTILNKIPLRYGFTLLIFGSHADGSAKQDSDLDLCFIVGNDRLSKLLKPYVGEAALQSPVDFDVHYITFDDFVSMLVRDEENLAKQIFRKNRMIFNPAVYFNLLKEAHKCGFSP